MEKSQTIKHCHTAPHCGENCKTQEHTIHFELMNVGYRNRRVLRVIEALFSFASLTKKKYISSSFYVVYLSNVQVYF